MKAETDVNTLVRNGVLALDEEGRRAVLTAVCAELAEKLQ